MPPASLEYPNAPFWDFSLRVYASDGVAPACLRLQERHDVDVNLLLFSLWLGEAGRAPADAGQLERLRTLVADWHVKVVKHLRSLRRLMKTPFPGIDDGLAQGLRARVQKAEIDAEHVEQIALWQAAEELPAAAPGDRPEATGLANAATYLRLIGARTGGQDAEDLRVILAAAFPDAPEIGTDTVERVLRNG